ncbi:MAG: hypothetical protein A2Y33_07620 [Spirochaetes bacterium GWF1_51_8]|nr:MAG: hypothetical protein A2Y33_07620 [Spirochaetes bacterium GWF1_51_8]
MPETNDIKSLIAEYARLTYRRGYLAGTEGNISARDGGTVLITASGVVKEFIAVTDIATIGMDGEPLEPTGPRPSTERYTHLEVYRARPDIAAVVHAHPRYVLLCNSLGIGLSEAPFTAEAAMFLSNVRTAPFARPSTSDGAGSLDGLLGDTNAVVLDRHGSLTFGKSVAEAFSVLEILEKHAMLTFLASLSSNKPRRFTDSELRALRNIPY